MVKTKQSNMLQNIIAVLVGAMLMGFLWRTRGESGWGSSWGLLNAGFVFTFFLILVKGERKKIDFGWFSLTVLTFMLTSPSWGTLLSQITGIIDQQEFAAVTGDPVFVSIPSALFLMACMGFGIPTIFALMLGRGFSSKQWKIKDLVIVLAVFFISDLLAKATFSHLIMQLIQPQAVEIFEKGLAAVDIEGNVYSVYMQHFNDMAWAKKIVGGRNYYSSIEAISATTRSVASILAVRFAVKDKISAKTGLVISAAFAFSITLSDLFFYFGNGGYHMEQGFSFGSYIAPWSCWEYFTGFFAGAIITAFMLKLKDEEDVPEIAFSAVPSKVKTILTFILGYIFMVGANIVRPVLVRYEDEPKKQIIFTVIAFLFALAVIIVMSFKWGINLEKATMTEYSCVLLPAFIIYIVVVYMFIGAADRIDYTSFNMLHTWLFTISAVLAFIWAIAVGRKKLKDK